MNTGIPLDQRTTADVLRDWLPTPAAEAVAENLARQGYVLVAANGLALHYQAERGDPSSLPPAAPEQAERIEAWCDPARSS